LCQEKSEAEARCELVAALVRRSQRGAKCHKSPKARAGVEGGSKWHLGKEDPTVGGRVVAPRFVERGSAVEYFGASDTRGAYI